MKTAAVIGCGKASEGKEGWAIGHAHAAGYLQARPGVALYGVDPNAENLRAFGEKFGLPDDRLFASTQALYAKRVPEVVSVCTWPALHHPMVLEAVAAGVKGIVCEKPMALDGSEVDEMLAACRDKGVRMVIAHQRRYNAGFEQARQQIAAGVLGEHLVLEARVGDGWDMLSWTVHWFDMANYLFDAEPESVLAGVDHTGQRRYQHAIENASVVFAQYPRQRQAIFITGPDAPAGPPVVVRGEHGLMQIDDGALHLLTAEGVQTVPPDPRPHEGFAGLVDDLARALRDNTPTRCDAEQASLATRMAWAAHESARTQRAIDPHAPAPVNYAPLEVLQHPATLAAQPQPFGPVTLLADDHHVDPETGISGRDGLMEALKAIGAEPRLVQAEQRELDDADLADANMLLLYHTQTKASDTVRRLIGEWVDSGKPLTVVHCGIGAYADWPAYRQWIGLHWVWGGEAGWPPSRHPMLACELDVVDPQRFASPWRTAWLPRDEVYMALGQTAPAHVLVNARTSEGDVPVAWQSAEHAHVAVWGPGHRPDIWQLDVMRQGLASTMALVRDGIGHTASAPVRFSAT
ncbi:MAG: Gfo/Idh/MocA family oxidoreductase [Phycisphaeraceae bacterium]